MRVKHPFEPIYDKHSEVLILGSFPSIKSRENNFYYSHPQNRFWKVLENVCHDTIKGDSKEAKIDFLLKHHIAIWDTIKECEIENSEDASIKNAVPNDISKILSKSKVKKIFCNGKASYKIFMKYYKEDMLNFVEVLPSTSPANAKYRLEDLVTIWSKNLKDILK